MNRLKLSLGGVWLIASVSALILPIFLPSYATTPGFRENPMAVSTLTMFILSFPSSVVAIPLIFMLYFLLGITTSTISGAYLTVVLLFCVGLFQWFWIVPRILWRPGFVQELELGEAAGNPRLFARDLNVWVDAQGSTPLERVLEEVEGSKPSSPGADPQ